MLPEQRGLLSGFFSRFRNSKRYGRKAKNRFLSAGWRAAVEPLEARRLLVSRVFIDFGDAFPVQATGPFAGTQTLLAITAATLQTNLVGVGGQGQTDQDLLGEFAATPTGGLDLMSFATFLDSPVFNPQGLAPADPATLEAAIVEQIKQALEPFDIQVIPADGNLSNFPVATLAAAGRLEGLNNQVGTIGAPAGDASATVLQYGSDDVYLFIGAEYTLVNNIPVPVFDSISADFAVNVTTPFSQPNRLDSGAIIDASYFLQRVLGNGSGTGTPTDPGLGFGGTGGSYNIALANASLYAIGWDYGLSEVENGTPGPFTNFFDPNVQLVNQAGAMQEAGFTEGFFINGVSPSLPISDTEPAYFPNFNMMQAGMDFNAFMKNPTLGNPSEVFSEPFPLPPLTQDTTLIFPPTFSVNTDPAATVNLYQQMASDPDIGPNPDVVGYVTGTGAYDQIFITRLNATQAKVTVNAYTDDTYTTLVSQAAADDGDPGVVSSYSYTINLTKTAIPGRKDDGKAPTIIVDGLNNNDQVFLDPTLGVGAKPVLIEVHGGADVKTLNITGNGTYNAVYTPAQSTAPLGTSTIINTYAASLLPEGLIPGAAGTLVITGSTVVTTTTTVGKKTTTTKATLPVKTTIMLDHFNPGNESALQLDGFNQLDYTSPGFTNNEYNVVDMLDGSWQISGQNDSTFNPPSLTGNLQFNNIKQFIVDTSKGASTDTVSFATSDEVPTGLHLVSVVMGAQGFGGQDELDFNDSLNADGSPNLEDQNYLISSTQLLPVQSAGSVFTGFTYSGVELLTLNGTQGTDQFTVTPSTKTTYVINGDPSAVQNTLAVHLAGTQYHEFDDTTGNGQWSFDNRMPITFTNIQNIVNQFGKDGVNPADYQSNPVADNASPIYAGSEDSDILAVAASSDSGVSKPLVQVYSAITNKLLYSFYAFSQTFGGGVRVTTADVNGDNGDGTGTPDIIVATGAGTLGEVRVFDGLTLQNAPKNAAGLVTNPNAAILTDITPEAGFKNGFNVASADVDGDGTPDLIVSNGKGAPTVMVFLNNGSGVFNAAPDTTFAAYPKTMVSGVLVAAGDVDGDGISEIVTAPGVGQVALIKVFSYADVSANPAAAPIRQFNGFETTFKGGVSLTMGDLDGDGLDEIILGAGQGGKSRVRVFTGNTGTLEREFQAYTTGNINAPVKVLARDIDGSGVAELYTTPVGTAVTHTVQLLDPLSVTNPLVTPLIAPLVDTIMESAADMKTGINLG
ncbi:MAG TPA: VCBS repeat-containing protein [Pirellulales bacterium]|nr:VCBS repeat-containing protein [Pirellulales bacterium]